MRIGKLLSVLSRSSRNNEMVMHECGSAINMTKPREQERKNKLLNEHMRLLLYKLRHNRTTESHCKSALIFIRAVQKLIWRRVHISSDIQDSLIGSARITQALKQKAPWSVGNSLKRADLG